MENVFNDGTLVQLKVSVWGIKKKLPSSDLNIQADPDYIRAVKFLVDKESLKPVEQARNFARGFLRDYSLPFPVTGVCFIPKRMISQVDERLKKYQSDFDDGVRDFIGNYETSKEVAKNRLKNLFNETDYPSRIGRFFSFEWQFFTMAGPDKASIVDPEIYAREQARFTQMIGEFRENAVMVLRERFQDMVNRIVDRLTGEKKIFKNSTVENIQEFLTAFEGLNINDDQELKKQVERVEAVLKGIDPEDLRKEDAFRAEIAGKMTEVKEALDGMMTNRPRRALFMEEVS